MKIDAMALHQLYCQTIEQMEDGELDTDSYEAFREFTADYPSSAWLADYRRAGGTASDDEAYEVEKALMDLAERRLT